MDPPSHSPTHPLFTRLQESELADDKRRLKQHIKEQELSGVELLKQFRLENAKAASKLRQEFELQVGRGVVGWVAGRVMASRSREWQGRACSCRGAVGPYATLPRRRNCPADGDVVALQTGHGCKASISMPDGFLPAVRERPLCALCCRRARSSKSTRRSSRSCRGHWRRATPQVGAEGGSRFCVQW